MSRPDTITLITVFSPMEVIFVMDVKELIRSGRLSEARKQLVEEVKSSPADVSKRTLLFQVLALCGEWDKADRHLDVIVAQDASTETGVQVYKNLIHAEKERIEVFKRTRYPSLLTKAPSYFEMYFAAWDKLLKQDIEESQKLYDQIETLCPPLSGTINGKSFSGFRDMDDLLSLFIEVIVHERYVWIPCESLRELSIAPPKTLFDLLWITVHITTWEGLSLNCYMPVLYPESFLHEDERVKLGRMTDWIPLGGPFYRGRGQHVFQVGEAELALLEIRELVFELSANEMANETTNETVNETKNETVNETKNETVNENDKGNDK
jgi:type VI secretion system protein ImpE